MPYQVSNVRVFPWLSWDDVGRGYYPLAWSETDFAQRKYIGVRLCLTFA